MKYILTLLLTSSIASSFAQSIVPGSIWNDDKGEVINAHGGGLLYQEGTYYWYGEKRGRSRSEGVNVYSSKDLSNWKFEALALDQSDDTSSVISRGCLMERPKVIFNERTKKYVMWFHLELRGQGYSAARAAVAVSDKATGPFKFDTSFRPNGNMSRDMGLFVDEDGSAYHIYSSRENYDLRIARLSDDYRRPTNKDVMLFSNHREAPALMKKDGKYFLITSGCTGWTPNKAALHEATSLFGPWTYKGDPMRGAGADTTFGGQSTSIQQVYGKKDAYIFLADKWNPRNLKDSRYLWLPVSFSNEGMPFVEWKDKWEMNQFADQPAPPKAALPGVNADPHIAYFNKKFYIYPTTDGTTGWMSTSFSAWSSKDLVNWKNEGVILDLPKDLTWAKERAWAPAIAYKNKKYYYYYSADVNIGVAVSNKPAGPFKDPLGKPLVRKGMLKGQMIDPMVFVDDDGKAYLYWGQGQCNMVPLNDDMISYDSTKIVSIKPEGYNEGPFVFKRKGKYYLMWSEYDTRDPRYSIAYATSDSPMGPFVRAANNPVIKGKGEVKGAGHHSVVRMGNTDHWFAAFHRFKIPGGNGYNRETCIASMHFDEQGNILPVDVYEVIKPLK